MKHLIYFADPMCSWCWGFSPVIDRISEEFGERAPVAVVMGGLFPGNSKPLNEQRRESIRGHWEHVNEASGQPFDHAFFEREGFVYDTEPPSRALVAGRRLDPGRTLPFLAHLHRAFYADNRDVTDSAVLEDVGADFGFDRDVFRAELDGQETLLATRQDFTLSRRLGVTGFPTLVGRRDQELMALTIGYRPWDVMQPVVASWLESTGD